MTTGDDVVLMSKAEFDALPEYSCSLPTGTTIGKTWRCNLVAYSMDGYQSPVWKMGEYVPHADTDKVGIRWRTIVVFA